MKIFILRHGDASPPIAGEPDNLRVLTDKGRQQVGKIAQWMKAHQYFPEHILSSPFARTLETAEIIKQQLDLDVHIEKNENLIFGSSPELIHSTLAAMDGNSVLLCSHMPLVVEMAHFFAPGALIEGFTTAEIIKIRYDFENDHGVVTANISPLNI